ncbi:hypothetical protein V6N13_031020 [Hibiscus sabdariffa]
MSVCSTVAEINSEPPHLQMHHGITSKLFLHFSKAALVVFVVSLVQVDHKRNILNVDISPLSWWVTVDINHRSKNNEHRER